jgi:glycosyltransferase involved in cell wall biosynthesis
MRVLLTSHGAGPYGAEKMLLSLAEGLTSRGHEVVLDFPHPGPALDAARKIGEVQVRVSGRPRLPRNLQEGVSFFLGIPRAIHTLRRLVREVKPDVTWVNSLFNPWAAVGAWAAGSPVVWHLHERNPALPLGLLAPALMGVTTTRVVAISSYVEGSLALYPWLRERIRRVENPLLNQLEPTGGEPEGPFTVGYVGQMEPRKRAPDLARAIAQLPGARAVFVGDGKARGSLEEAIASVGIEDRVELLGFRDDAPAEFHRFHCISTPSLREPFGLVALEAMARGIPVVAARSGALPEVLGDAALFHDPGNPQDLARQLSRLEGSRELRMELRERGFRRVALFKKERWLDAVEAVLGEISGGRGSG